MVNRKAAPTFNKDFFWSLPPVQIDKLSNGIDAIWLNQIEQSVAKIDFLFRGGKWYEPKIGVSYFTAHMLEKGTKFKKSSEIAELIDRYGAQLEISAGVDFVTISVYSLIKNLRDVITLVIEFLQLPSFDEKELGLLKNIYGQNIKINNEKSSYVASKLLRQNLFGTQHPYGTSLEEFHLNGLTPHDLKEFHKTCFTPNEIYITGPLSNRDFDWLKSQMLHFRQNEETMIQHALSPSSQTKEWQAKENSVQSSIRLGKRTIRKNHADYPGLILLNHILGGYFGSRLMKNIREEKGLTYGIYSSLTTFLEDGLFTIGADVNKENAELTIAEIRGELNKLSGELISKEELETAKSHLLGSMQLNVASPFSVIEKIKSIKLLHLREDYYLHLIEVITQTEPGRLQNLASKYLQESDLYQVIVG